MLDPLPATDRDCTWAIVSLATGNALIGSTMFNVSVETRILAGDPDQDTVAPVASGTTAVIDGSAAPLVVKFNVEEYDVDTLPAAS